ncbi:tetratricopeptide repeat-containing glycosyltransferase family protein [Gammaproteobacteria bacterium]|nr:tetratricopeptide repeat-containing glycosyltransferase family protein [Gammaproteobacteria bacterium]
MIHKPSDIIKAKRRAGEFIRREQIDQALPLLRRLCKAAPHDAEVWFMLAAANASLGNMADVIHACRVVITINPAHTQAWYNLGLALYKSEQLEESIEAYKTALNLQPTMHQAHENLAAALQKVGDHEQAMSHCQNAIRLQTNPAVAFNTLGILYREEGNVEKALDTFNHAIEADPNFTEAHWNRALARLKLGQYQLGWDEYEFRWTHEPKMQRDTPHPRWNGAARQGLKLLIYAEQGIGDQIMFASCLQDLSLASCEIILECESRLAPLFSRAFPFLHVHAGSWNEKSPECTREIDCHIPIGSLPRIFRRSVQAFPQHTGYLYPAPEQLAKWKSRFYGPRLKIGISWRGGNCQQGENTRSIPLSLWSELLQSKGIQIINLQYGDSKDEVSAFNYSYGVTVSSWEDVNPLADMDFFAAEISALNLVITVDNSTAHLAGALGIPTWTLLPFDSDWRWEFGRKTTPWYPSMRLYSQETPGDWHSVLDKVRNDLRQLLGTNKNINDIQR